MLACSKFSRDEDDMEEEYAGRTMQKCNEQITGDAAKIMCRQSAEDY
jgi:hypothetical protein